MTIKIQSPYKEEKPATPLTLLPPFFSFLISSSTKLGLVALLALLGLLNLSTSFGGVISRRKSLQTKETRRVALAVPSSHTITTVASNDDDDNNIDVEINEFSSSHDLLDEEMRRLLDERNQVGTQRGKVAWLMSFPNSGTSFTSLLVRVASNSTAATNYGMETRVGSDGMSVPIYDWSVEGPYWMHPPEENGVTSNGGGDQTYERIYPHSSHNNKQKGSNSNLRAKNELPPSSASILTKTHCGGRCTTCPPDKYLETIPSFLRMCLSGSRKVPSQRSNKSSSSAASSSSIQYKKQYVTYHPSVVERAIHIIRNPFDNLVSRFHHEQKEYKKKNRTSWTERYSNDVAGFKKWCVDVDSVSEKEYNSYHDHLPPDDVDWKVYGYNQTTILHDVRGVSCHAEFFRYAQWHIRAMQVVELLDIPVLYVHYEEYANDINDMTDQILNFLNLDRKMGEGGELPYFQSNKDYSAYFTREERASASEFMRRLVDGTSNNSSESRRLARELLERYWVEYDFKKLAAETGSIE